jgi:hypothetical protein
MNISPSIISWGMMPLSLLHLASSVVLFMHSCQRASGETPFIWRAIFFPGGVVLMLLVGMLIMIRWDERTRFARVDKIALTIALIAIAGFAGICLMI